MVEVSVVICCYNSSDRLRDTLSHLIRQDAPSDAWEVILVDNASTDDTARVAADYWGIDGPVPLRVVREDRPGIAHARTRGFNEAAGRFVCFVDDDNWLTESWVRLTMEIMGAHPEIGALGSRGEPASAVILPDWFEGIQRGYAVGPQAPMDGDVTDTVRYFWGAGLTIRKEAWDQLVSCNFDPILKGHTGREVTGGADSELVLAVGLAGWRLWYDQRLVFKHFLPEERLTWSYARRLHRGFGAAEWIPPLYGRRAAYIETRGRSTRMWASWAYLALMSCLNIVRLILRSPVETLRGMEGSHTVLLLERERGKLTSLLVRRKDFIQYRTSVSTFMDCVSSTNVDTKRTLS